jgi:hypothetical protein
MQSQQNYISPPTYYSNFELLQDKIFRDFFAHRIGIINVYNPSNNTATISIVDIDNYIVNVNTSIDRQFAPLIEVPVFRYATQNAGFTKPILAGDSVLLLFNDTNIDNFIQNQTIQQPFNDIRHDINNAIAIPFDFTSWLHNNNATEMFYQQTTKISLDSKVGIKNASGSLLSAITNLTNAITELGNAVKSAMTVPAVSGVALALDGNTQANISNALNNVASAQSAFNALLK